MRSTKSRAASLDYRAKRESQSRLKKQEGFSIGNKTFQKSIGDLNERCASSICHNSTTNGLIREGTESTDMICPFLSKLALTINRDNNVSGRVRQEQNRRQSINSFGESFKPPPVSIMTPPPHIF